MSIVFLNGAFLPAKDAKISIFDTGLYYGDGIYEVALLCDGRIVDIESHFARLKYVLKEAKFNNVPPLEEIKEMLKNLVLKNKGAKNGMIFLQITRGIMENRYSKLKDIEKATIIAYIVETEISFDVAKKAVSCELIEEPRRYRRDIKMTSLMPMNIAKMQAQEKGYDYVIFKDRATKAITEGASSNIFIITKDGIILTHPTGKKILSGCTRKRTIEFLKEAGYEVKEQEFFEEDLLDAKEAFLTGAIKLYAPIKSVNGEQIGSGEFKIAEFCMKKYEEFIKTFPQIV
jgi:D-alanine transaminase